MRNKLSELAFHAYNGACNPLALIVSLAESVKGMSQDQMRKSTEVKIVVGQISYLLGESCGPTSETLGEYRTMTEDAIPAGNIMEDEDNVNSQGSPGYDHACGYHD
jgi:hypothetical protein